MMTTMKNKFLDKLSHDEEKKWGKNETDEHNTSVRIHKRSSTNLLASGATANIISLLTIGAFLTGYLEYLGASEQYIAMIAVMPQLGSILQLVSPYVFEKLKSRKVLIVLSCFLFRFSVSTIFLVPYLTDVKQERLLLIFLIYTFAFLIAGFVTPGLDHWFWRMIPEEGRGKFLAKKDVISMISVSIVSMVISRMLDYYKAENAEMKGFTIMLVVALALSVLDGIVLSGIDEEPNEISTDRKSFFETVFEPLRDKSFNKIIVFLCIWNFAVQLSTAFIPLLMIRYFSLSYSFIAITGVAANFASMLLIYIWGHLADKSSWFKVQKYSGALMLLCYFGWFFIGGNLIKPMVIILQILLGSSRGAFMMATSNIIFRIAPAIGKTAYFGVASSISYVISFLGGVLGSVLSLWLQEVTFTVLGYKTYGIQLLFLLTSILMVIAMVLFRVRDGSFRRTNDFKGGIT